jgi:molecular chaperone GrpE
MSEDKSQGGDTNSTGDVADEVDETTKLRAELDKSKKDYLYLLAEFDNYRRNSIKERSDLTKYGSERFIREFLDLFDNFERALDVEVTGENYSNFREGIGLNIVELRSLLHRFGVEEVKAVGLPFDPNKHEALSGEPSTDIPVGHVVNVFKKAYKMYDKLIRPAQVTVAVAPTKN